MSKEDLLKLLKNSGGLDEATVIAIGEYDHCIRTAQTLIILGMPKEEAYRSAFTPVGKESYKNESMN